MAENEVDQFMAANRVAPPVEKKPDVTLPDNYEDPDLKPRLANTPETQLLEYKVRMAAKQAGFDPHIAAAVAQRESGFNPEAVSPTGVRGLMQVSGIAAKDVGMDPSKVRHDVDSNIEAGVQYLAKHGLDKYPDPAVRDSYVKGVTAQAQKSRDALHGDRFSDIEAEINGGGSATPQSGIYKNKEEDKSTGLAGMGLSAAKSYLDALGVGFVERQLDKVPGARQASELLNNIGSDNPKSFNQMSEEGQSAINKAQSENKISSALGTAGGVLAQGAVLSPILGALGLAPKAAEVGSMLSRGDKIANAAKILTQGAVQGGAYEGLTNKEATPESIGKMAALGAGTTAVMAPVLKGAAALSKGFGKALINFAVKAGKPEVGEYITKYLGPTLNKASLEVKNQSILDKTEEALQAKLQSITKSNPAAQVNMRDIAQDPKMLKMVESLDNTEERTQGSKLLNRLISYAKRESISLEDANQLKRDLYKQSNFNSESKKLNIALLQKSVALNIKDAIEHASGSGEIKALNQTLSNGIELKQALKASTSPSRLRTYLELAAAIAHPTSIPVIAAERFATSVPGSTLIGSAGSNIAKGLNTASPQIQNIMSALLPQKFKN